MIRFATIGTSRITEKFLAAAAFCSDFHLEAVYSRDLERAKAFASAHGAEKCYDSLDALAADSAVDAVYIGSPNASHYEQAICMMKAGKHVLCEKAMASNSREVETMFQVAQEHQVLLMEAMRPLFYPGYQLIRENLHKLGAIRGASIGYGQFSSRYEEFRAGTPKNIFDPKCSAGALMDIGVYCVHMMIGILGEPEEISASSVKLWNGIDGSGMILASYPEMTAVLNYSKITDSKIPSEIQGEEGVMLIDSAPEPNRITILLRNGKQEVLEPEIYENDMVYELEKFLRAIQGKENIEHYQKISRAAMKWMDLARQQSGIVFPSDQVAGADENQSDFNRLEKQLAFIVEIDKVKNIVRQTYLADGERKENDAEHSWHIALMASLLKEHVKEEIDVSRVMQMVLIHDLVEIDAGDTYAYDLEGAKDKQEREMKAAERIFGILPQDQKSFFFGLWNEFEAYETAEAKYAHLLDNFQPLLLNDVSGGISWKEHQVHKEQIYQRNRKVEQSSTAVWEYMKQVVQKQIEKGNIIE